LKISITIAHHSKGWKDFVYVDFIYVDTIDDNQGFQDLMVIFDQICEEISYCVAPDELEMLILGAFTYRLFRNQNFRSLNFLKVRKRN
jgi:hypothetical protein